MGCVKSVGRDAVLERLAKLFEGLNDVEVAVLFGSLARGSLLLTTLM